MCLSPCWLSGQVGWYFDFLFFCGTASSSVRLCFSTMADGSQSSSQTPDMNIAMLAKSVTTLQKQFQQICDALSGKLGNDSDDCSDNEGCNSDLDGRSESGSQVNYHKGTADQSCPGSSAAGLGGGDAILHGSTIGTPVWNKVGTPAKLQLTVKVGLVQLSCHWHDSTRKNPDASGIRTPDLPLPRRTP